MGKIIYLKIKPRSRNLVRGSCQNDNAAIEDADNAVLFDATGLYVLIAVPRAFEQDFGYEFIAVTGGPVIGYVTFK